MNLNIPQHIAIIMDGNGRWGERRGLPRTLGHIEGVKALRRTLKHAGEIGVKYLSVFAFSTENWKRSTEEVSTLMMLFKKFLKSEEKEMMKQNVRFILSGSKDALAKDLCIAVNHLEEVTKNNDGIILNVAFNYGGRRELIEAVNKILAEKKDEITEEEFSNYLYQNIPYPDLLIRTSGEMRMSNFMIWQLAYAEFYATDTLWPDFAEEDLDLAIENFNKRVRKFGGNDVK